VLIGVWMDSLEVSLMVGDLGMEDWEDMRSYPRSRQSYLGPLRLLMCIMALQIIVVRICDLGVATGLGKA